MDVTVHGTTLAPVDQALIRRYDAMLWARYDRLQHCGLRVDAGPRAKGGHFNYLARVDLALPSGEIVVAEPARLDRFTAIQDALDEAARRLQHYALEKGRVESQRPFYHPDAGARSP